MVDPYYGDLKAYDADGSLSGKLIVSAPSGRTTYHEGIEIVFTSTSACTAVAGALEQKLIEKKWTLLDPGYISEAIEIPFDLDLSKMPDVRENLTTVGMYVKNTIGFKIYRPWWTFPVQGEEIVGICSFAKEPPKGEPLTIEVSDFGGKATLTVDSDIYALDGDVKGELVFSCMEGCTPIAGVTLIVGRTETCEHVNDFEARMHELSKDTVISGDLKIPVAFKMTDLTEGGDKFANLPPTMPKLVPADPEIAQHVQEVTYWIRLLLTGEKTSGEPKTWWNTMPITLVRTRPTPSESKV
jgi:hypothetical protein